MRAYLSRHYPPTGAAGLGLTRLLVLLSLLCLTSPALAQSPDGKLVKQYFPQSDSFTEFEGEPPASKVSRGGKLIGYVFRTKPIAPIPAYSGKPIDMLVGLDLEGNIVGARVIEHHEPILLVGIPESRLDDFTRQYRNKSIEDKIKVGAGAREGYVNIDAITGATVTVMVMNEVIIRASRKVAIAYGLIEAKQAVQHKPARVREEYFKEADWKELTGNGAIRRMHLTRGEVDKSFIGTDAEGIDTASLDEADDTFIDLYYGHLNAPTIGRNLLGESQYNWLMAELKPGEHAIAVMGKGIYSFKGSGYVRGGIFDRILVRQNDREISFRDLDHYRLNDVFTPGMPAMDEMAIFIIRDSHNFDPGSLWELELLVKRQTTPLESAFSSFSSTYEIPEAYIERPTQEVIEEADEPIWLSVWMDRKFQIGVLVAGLLFLTVIMALQDWLSRFPKLFVYLRNGFLVYTLFFIGWYLLGQLSVVNVFAFTGSILHQDFSWETFLIDPTMFILWVFVAASLLLWGRGVYCGWLCPFGALQKLINQIAMKANVRQFKLPQVVHDRLWGIKYIILLVLFAISLQSLSQAERYAEIEPFKTAITLRFDRELPFLIYAVGLLVISIFNCKFYCKYLCPLGAALAVPAKLRLTSWLRRRKECGHPCQICANECEIQAIHHTGEINLDECHFCMDCQMTYWNDHKCPPLIDRRRKRERAVHTKLKEPPMGGAKAASGKNESPINFEPNQS
ncbi:MAG: 4Fe-4S binding protein [Pseudomonadota bacterium]